MIRNGLPMSAQGAHGTVKRVVLSGFATLDYVMVTQASGDGISGTCSGRIVADGWPRAGGAALYAARQIAAAGHFAAPIVTVGTDAHGIEYLRQCEQAGLAVEGIVQYRDARTPVCVLAYHRDGNHTCLLDPGAGAQAALTASQKGLLHMAEFVVIAAAAPATTQSVLMELHPQQRLAWIAKRDGHSFPDGLRKDLARRADVIFCNRGERDLVDEFRTQESVARQTVVETRGADGALVEWPGGRELLPARPLDVLDATGAGDTLAGATLARLVAGGTDPLDAVAHGIGAAHRMLQERTAIRGRDRTASIDASGERP
ncbi:carbohydrate kinase family protein [Pseudoxanthomonas putridarboris]|uniref:PfkB family carbohydrate kinase n=1 Tax=Pseudoxanthomonas putridarboris TaxID=752605 RepID=A0ABU9IYT3_9GAMM